MTEERQQLEATIRGVLAAANGAVPKTTLVRLVEQQLGRPLTETEKGLGIWRARESFLAETKTELLSKNGALKPATAGQSVVRRQKERTRALKTLERSVQRATQLAENNDLTDDERRRLEAAADKANNMLVHATASMRRRSLPRPRGL